MKQKIDHGKFVISLDFELYWGVRDKRTIEGYAQNLKGVHTVLPKLIDLFNQHKTEVTFSTVGFLFCKNKEELMSALPQKQPLYDDKNLSPYTDGFKLVGNSENDDPYHFAYSLLQLLKQYAQHEIGTHTFSHYYCLESGQTVEDFRADMQAAHAVAEKENVQLTSLVFPRNQYNESYLNVCRELNITSIRGNETSWLYAARSGNKEQLYRRALRLVDAYLNISGHNCYSDEYMTNSSVTNIPSSRFLRPYSPKLQLLDGLRLNRITSGMTYAAKNNLMYHLWWHPHNMGIHQKESLNFLNKILKHYRFLNEKYNFESYTMTRLCKQLNS